VIDSASQAADPSTPFTEVVLTLGGENFRNDARVFVGGAPCAPVTVAPDGHSLACTTAKVLAAGRHAVVVKNADWTTGSRVEAFVVAGSVRDMGHSVTGCIVMPWEWEMPHCCGSSRGRRQMGNHYPHILSMQPYPFPVLAQAAQLYSWRASTSAASSGSVT